ncbi:MAG: hypothetical protein LBK42_09235 [Propionibacteriaceae bacterium]|jgi:hypothetical protein|nr:hypothetical protein [Propionibacteriaceae bacterium]
MGFAENIAAHLAAKLRPGSPQEVGAVRKNEPHAGAVKTFRTVASPAHFFRIALFVLTSTCLCIFLTACGGRPDTETDASQSSAILGASNPVETVTAGIEPSDPAGSASATQDNDAGLPLAEAALGENTYVVDDTFAVDIPESLKFGNYRGDLANHRPEYMEVVPVDYSWTIHFLTNKVGGYEHISSAKELAEVEYVNSGLYTMSASAVGPLQGWLILPTNESYLNVTTFLFDSLSNDSQRVGIITMSSLGGVDISGQPDVQKIFNSIRAPW